MAYIGLQGIAKNLKAKLLKGTCLNFLIKSKAMSEAKGELAVLIAKWVEASKGRELVSNMIGERLTSELLTFQTNRFNRLLRDLESRLRSFFERYSVFENQLTLRGVPLEKVIDDMKLAFFV